MIPTGPGGAPGKPLLFPDFSFFPGMATFHQDRILWMLIDGPQALIIHILSRLVLTFMRISDMNRKETTCRYAGLDKEYSIEELAAFHGHLGPYIVLGYRIGRYAKENFCPDPFLMRASVFCAGMPRNPAWRMGYRSAAAALWVRGTYRLWNAMRSSASSWRGEADGHQAKEDRFSA